VAADWAGVRAVMGAPMVLVNMVFPLGLRQRDQMMAFFKTWHLPINAIDYDHTKA
jgi:hypothetical protein